MNTSLTPVTLVGQLVTLSPLKTVHLPQLLEVIKQCDFPITTTPKNEQELIRYIDKAVASAETGKALPFVISSTKTQTIVGSTRLANVEWWDWDRLDDKHVKGFPDAIEIGWTWLAPQAHGTGINAEAKLLQLQFAFEELKVKKVILKTDERNAVSRKAIGNLGAHFDGILRCHSPAADTGVRNTAIFSILDHEWPAIKENLVARVLSHVVRE